MGNRAAEAVAPGVAVEVEVEVEVEPPMLRSLC